MTTIYFVRHVQAMGNIQRIFQGAIDTDIPLRDRSSVRISAAILKTSSWTAFTPLL